MRALIVPALLAALAAGGGWRPAAGQEAAAPRGAQVPFGDFEHDASLPVEITSDALALDQAARTAIFTGAVKVGQGALRLAADRLEVRYLEDANAPNGQGGIERMLASGNVTLSNGTEAAEARTASYVVATGVVEMDGDVLLTQGGNALSGQKMHVDLNAGAATMEGRVQTIIIPGKTPGGAPGAAPKAAP